MTFGIRCRFDRIQSYADALRVWRKAVIFPRVDNEYAPRGLVDKRKKHLAIERTAAQDIILRLYDHPVVTWHKDGSLTIDTHPTKSTGIFANHCTPGDMYVRCGSYHASAVSTGGLTYNASKPITFKQNETGKWRIADRSQITPWSVEVVNRERAKQALAETGYNDFRLWFKTYVQMATKPEGKEGFIDNTSIVIMLRDRSKWRDLVACRFLNAWGFPDRALHEIRQAVYQECGCIDRKSVPFLG